MSNFSRSVNNTGQQVTYPCDQGLYEIYVSVEVNRLSGCLFDNNTGVCAYELKCIRDGVSADNADVKPLTNVLAAIVKDGYDVSGFHIEAVYENMYSFYDGNMRYFDAIVRDNAVQFGYPSPMNIDLTGFREVTVSSIAEAVAGSKAYITHCLTDSRACI